MCPPSLRGRYPTSSLLWGHPTSHESLGFLRVDPLCHPTSSWKNPGDLPSSRLYLDDVPRSKTPVDPRKHWYFASLVLPSPLLTGSASTVLLFITRLNPFTLSHCSPSSPCVRFADRVTVADATLSTRCLTRAFGAGIYLRLAEPSFARRTSNRTITNAKAESPTV
jgi:hypothetical protein